MSLEQEFEKLDKKVEQILKKSEKTLTKNYKKTLEELRTTIRKLYDKYADSESKLSMDTMSKYGRIENLEKDIITSVARLYKDNNKLIKATLTNICVTTKDNIVDVMQEKTNKSLMSIKKKLDIDNVVNEKMAGLHWSTRMNHHRSNVIYEINSTLKQGLAQGSTYKDMSDSLKDKLGANVLYPMRIIRTEGARVYASTQKQSLDKISDKGLKMLKKWLSAKDERVRSQHKQMDGVIIPYEDDFVLPDGLKTKMPHLSGYAHHDIHCRCIVTIELADTKENVQENMLIENQENYTPDIVDKQEEIKQEEVKKEQKLKYTQKDIDDVTKWYVSGDGQWINQYLRGNTDIVVTDKEQEMIDILKCNADSEIVKEKVLYRSVDAKAVFGDISDLEYQQLKDVLVYKADDKFSIATKEKFTKNIKGKEILEKGFMSTTKNMDIALEWRDFTGSSKAIVLEFEVPQGIKGKDLAKFDIYGDKQYEVLLSPNQKYVIKELTSKQGNIYVKAELIAEKNISDTVEKLINTGYNNTKIYKTLTKAQVDDLQKYSSSVFSTILENEKESVYKYTSGDYRKINKQLREKGKDKDIQK
ncbi:MAG: phage minor head protein [Peptoanaerobacter stomatis]|uniref:phage minor head protein n=1 Tax=Peptoanaerobacter stomatis TaxID=796937 RepID=UPI003FA18FC8